MAPSDLAHIRTRAADASRLVRQLADQTHTMSLALTREQARSDIGSWARILDSLADVAQSAADALDDCVASMHGTTVPEDAPKPDERLQLVYRWFVLLDRMVQTAASVYAEMCDYLADHVAVIEEHSSSSSASAPATPTVANLVAVAHALRHPRTD